MGAESEAFGSLSADDTASQEESETTDSSEQTDIPEVLPPEKILDTPNLDLLKGLIPCLKTVDQVRKYVAYENQHKQRDIPLKMLSDRAEELRE